MAIEIVTRRGHGHATFIRAAVAAALLATLAGCATFGEPVPPPPSLAEIVESAKAGQSPQQIIERMQRSHAVYRLPASELAKLREQGVPDAVIDYMQRVHLDVVRFEESVRARSFYGPGWGPWGPAYGWRDPFWPYRRRF
ncbi:MAG: hypothetical protein ACK515_27460 [bacterium]|jgi:hypothetical protein|nr:hypothetical protein [Betaproteobacteria bacterium]